MLSGYEYCMAAEILRAVQAKKIAPIEKVFLHKFTYFLDTQGVPTGFRFRPYTYGPYSFDLANTLGDMAFWDAIEEHNYFIKPINLKICEQLDSSLRDMIQSGLDKFLKILGKKRSFSDLEQVGTVLYCIQAITQYGGEVNEKEVVKEFKEWKGTKYPDKAIIKTFSRIQSVS